VHRERRQRLRTDAALRAREDREWALHIAAWYLDVNPGSSGETATRVLISNGSSLPVYEVVVTLVILFGGGAKRGPETGPEWPCRAFVAVLPPRRWLVDLPIGWAGMHREPGVEIAFMDSAGRTWVREPRGLVIESHRVHPSSTGSGVR